MDTFLFLKFVKGKSYHMSNPADNKEYLAKLYWIKILELFDCVDVDINHNCDFRWDLLKYFNTKAPVQTSNDPCDYQIYNGPSAFSWPETRNAKWIFDNFPNICFFIDLQSYSWDILYSRGDDDDQMIHSNMDFQNPTYNNLRGITGDPDYKGYIYSVLIFLLLSTSLIL